MVSVHCKRCGKEVSAGEVRYVSEDKFFCADCYLASSGKGRSQEKRDGGKYDVAPVSYERLVCDKCGFRNRFRSGSQTTRRCSYCGSEELHEPTSTAAKLIEEADEDTV